MKTSRVLLLLASFVLAAACGTKGPLVLPGKETPRQTVEPIHLPEAADASQDEVDAGEPADAAKPAEPPAEE